MAPKTLSIFFLVLPAITIGSSRNRVPQARPVSFAGLTCIPAASCTSRRDAFGATRVPKSGELLSLTLTWRFGSIMFYDSVSKKQVEGIFGPKTSRKVGIFVTRDNNQVVYPESKTEGYSAIQGTRSYYNLASYQTNAKTITFQSRVHVRRGDILRFYFGDVLFGTDFSRSQGSICVSLIYQYRFDRAPYPTAGVTCLPLSGDKAGAYGAARIPTGADKLENLTLTYSFGQGEFCVFDPPRCKAGNFGYGNSIPVYVYRENGTLMFPVQGKTIGYHPNPNPQRSFGGYYRMDGNTGTGQSITFRLPQQKRFAAGELVKIVFGNNRLGGWQCKNGGTVCVHVKGMAAAEPPPTVFGCQGARGFKHVCTCRSGKCDTFDGYRYQYDQNGYDIRVYLVKPAPPLFLLPFTVSASLGSRGTKVVRIALKEDSLFKEYVEIALTSGVASFRRASDPQGQMTLLVDGVSNEFKNGKFVYSNIGGGKVSQIFVFFGSRIPSNVENVLIQVDSERTVSVTLTDCYKEHVVGMCGGFQGDRAKDEKLMRAMKPGDFKRLKDPNFMRMSLQLPRNSRRPRGRSMNVAFDNAGNKRAADAAVPIWIGVGIFVCGMSVCGAFLYGVRLAKRRDWDPIAE